MLTALAAFNSDSDLQTVLQLLRTGDVNAKASQVRPLLVNQYYFIMCQSLSGLYCNDACVCGRQGRRHWCWRSVMAEGTWWKLCCPVGLRWTCVMMTAPQLSCVPVNTVMWILCGSCCLCQAVMPRSLIMWLFLCLSSIIPSFLLPSSSIKFCFSSLSHHYISFCAYSVVCYQA